MSAAFRYGFLAPSHVMAFIECVWWHGSGFYREEPWARAILREDAVPLDEKLSRLRAGRGGQIQGQPEEVRGSRCE